MNTTRFPGPEDLIAALQQSVRREFIGEGYARAAVLVPLTPRNGDYDLLLTTRTDAVETHKGQVAFPGGVMDRMDGTVVETALREAEEELGIPPAVVRVAGLLEDLATPTGFVITPVVGLLDQIPLLVPNAAEVADVFRLPLSFFADGRNGYSERRTVQGKEYDLWFYESGSHLIWGVTAAIIRALLRILSGINPPGQIPAA